MYNKVFETKNLIIRPFSLNDATDVYEYSIDELVGPRAGWNVHRSIEETKVIIQNVLMADSWAIVLKKNMKVIGSIGLMQRNSILYEIGYVLNRKYWGNGYMPETVKAIMDYAFQTQIEVICTGHFPENNNSKRVIEKCGFKFEGVLRKAYVKGNGEVTDYVRYSITKEEYMEEKINGC